MDEIWEESAAGPKAPVARAEASPLDLSGFLAVVRRGWWKLLLWSLLGLATGLAGARFWPMRYKAVCAVFLVQGMKAETQAQELLGAGPRPNQAYASAILKSKTVAEDVLRALKKKDRTPTQLQRSLEVSGSKEGILTVAYSAANPGEAVELLSEYLKAYRRYTDGSVLTVAKGERVFIEKQVQLCKERLKNAEEAVLRFEKAHAGGPQADSLRSAVTGAYAENLNASTALHLARAKEEHLRVKTEASLDRLREHSTAPSTLEDNTLAALQAEIVQARVELNNLKIAATDEDPEVKAQREKIARLQQVADQRVEELAQSYRRGLNRSASETQAEISLAQAKLHVANQNLNSLKPRLQQLLEQDMERLRLRREFDVQDKLYRDLELALQNSLLAEAKEPIYLVVLDQPAVVVSRTQTYRYPLFGVAGLGLGLLVGLCLITARYLWSRS